jgi:hypothetical protein
MKKIKKNILPQNADLFLERRAVKKKSKVSWSELES